MVDTTVQYIVFCVIIQKRLAALNAGARALVDLDTKDKMEIVVQEILQDKIYLDSSNQMRVKGDGADGGGPPDLDLSNL
jgi:DNA-directed RNA polymerase subunit omega